MNKYLLHNYKNQLSTLRNKDFLLLQSSYYPSDYAALLIRFRTEIVDLSVFVPRPFILPKSLHSSLSTFRFAFQLFSSMHSQILYPKATLGKRSGYAVPERSATPTQYVALALKRVPCIFLDIYIYIIYKYIYIRARRNLDFNSTHLGLASLVQKSIAIPPLFSFMETLNLNVHLQIVSKF